MSGYLNLSELISFIFFKFKRVQKEIFTFTKRCQKGKQI